MHNELLEENNQAKFSDRLFHLLFRRECCPLLQIGAGAEAGLDLAGENHSSCRACFAFVVNTVDLATQLG